MERIRINRIAVLLIEKNMSQKELAEELNKTTACISNICKQKHQPRMKDLPVLAKIFGVTMDKLVVAESPLESED